MWPVVLWKKLLCDYQDYLRQHNLTLWEVSSAKARSVRGLVYNSYNCYNNYNCYMKAPESAANSMVCLINQTNRLLDQKIRWLMENFVKKGGFKENLLKKRLDFLEGR